MNQISFQDVKQTSTTPVFAVGQRAQTPDGNEWVYVKATEAIGNGHVVISKATAALGAGTLTSALNGDGKHVIINYSTGGLTIDEYAGKWINIDVGTGIGQVAKIKSNNATTITLFDDYALTTSLGADSTAKIIGGFDVRKAVVTSEIQNAKGVAQCAIASGSYGFVQTRGIGMVMAGGVVSVGASFTTGDDTAGQVVIGTTAKGEYDEESLGVALVANTAADTGLLAFFKIS